MLTEVLASLRPAAGEVVFDCTVGWAGHAVEALKLIGPSGRLIGCDFDADNLPRARERLEKVGSSFSLHHGNFAGLSDLLAREGNSLADVILADLGMSSMQVDDADRGFSYSRDGPLDMRMDRSRGRTAAEILTMISERDLANALRELGDEPEPERVARAIVEARATKPLERTSDLAEVLLKATHTQDWKLHPSRGKWNLHPAARTFQALRILVNRELNNLEALLRQAPACLRPGGRIGIISFHSGEDRIVKQAFRDGLRSGSYQQVAAEAVRASECERLSNPRSRSAKLRWAVRSDDKSR